MHEYKKWHKLLSKELCDYMDCFEEEPAVETLCVVEKIAKTIVKLQEMETYELMFDCLEDCFGYDREEGEFEDKDGGSEMMLYAIYNAYSPARMNKRSTGAYPTMGQGYGIGADRRYGEYSTDRAMYPYSEYGWMNAYDGDRSRMSGQDRRYGERDGRMGDGYMNAGRERDRDRGDRRERGSRGRYMNAAERKETKEKLHKLSDSDKEEWMDSLEGPNGTGPMFTKEEVVAVGKKMGIKFDDFSELDLTLVTNMMFSDFVETAKKMNVNRLDFYVSLAKDFLCDEDSVDPEMKLAAYKEYIVEDDDD